MAKLKRKTKLSLPSLVSLQDAPPGIRISNSTAMKAEWRDIDDVRPNAARTARTVTGWRGYDPLRKCLGRPGSAITQEHVIAADQLRRLADSCVIGQSGPRELTAAQSWNFGPRTGFGGPALRSAKAWPRFRRAMAMFTAEERRLVTAVVLLNRSVRAWCAEQRALGVAVNPAHEMQSLVRCLDLLVGHFESEIEREIGQAVV